ncbi:NUDIX domain-containing protein [Kaistia dalseonensis]|uniref:GDP-mannose pyrophosphatase n=1 Tax=Kaistia dalseonensis TaxID=410840 RepID=A0ABU0H2I5_9HYPH|nr:NUDIX domain-containing protein [Kaistia dalseonensis]MCX5493131.1 NUDIX domain-containing protein [Kaistia dalseonensis]MDQ0435686.1 nudix-type nucleoside diphosphatase (YffH/AdpP family) [Kaistia dalseonensis]
MTDWNDRVRLTESKLLSDNWGRLHRNVFDYRRSDGTWQTQVRETYDRGDGAAVLAYDPDRGTVLLIRQFRFPAWKRGHAEPLIEVCAGLLDADDPVACIRKEAEEEMGIRLDQPVRVMVSFMSPGSVVEQLHLFVARYTPGDRNGAGGGHEDEGEDIEVLELPFAEALAMIDDGRICDAKTIMLLQYAALKGLLPA